jgi:hypothetical protein
MVEASLDVPAKSRIVLEFSDNVQIEAHVRWCQDDRLGVEFTGKVDHQDLKRRTFAGRIVDTRVDMAA